MYHGRLRLRRVPVSVKGLNGRSSRYQWLTLPEYITERRSSRSATMSGSLNTTICEPMTLRCKIFVSEIPRRQTIHKPQPGAVLGDSSLTILLGHLRKSLPDRVRWKVKYVADDWETFGARWVRGTARSPFLSCQSENDHGHGHSQGWTSALLQGRHCCGRWG